MKKTKIILFTFIISFWTFLCSDNIQREQIQLTILNGMERIGLDVKPKGKSEIHIKSAKNEYESFQVVVTAPIKNLKITSVKTTDLEGKNGAKIENTHINIFREEYIRVKTSSPRAELPPGLYPDALIPLKNPITGEEIKPLSFISKNGKNIITGQRIHGLPIDIFKGQNQPFWIDVYIPKNTPAGNYKGLISITDSDTISKEIPIHLTVWDFSLPDGPTHNNHFGNFTRIAEKHNVKRDTEEYYTIERRYCKSMAEHRINPPIPKNLLPEVNKDGSLTILSEKHKALEQFIKELNVTNFEIPRAPFEDIINRDRQKAIKYYKDFYNYLKQNGWDKGAYLYMLDEPNTKEAYQLVRDLGDLVKDATPEIRRLVVEQTFLQNPEWGDIDSAIDIWCPLFGYIDEESINEKIKNGDDVWSYTALVQRASSYHPNYQIVKDKNPPYWQNDFPPINYRIPLWINYRYNITGLLYWTTVWWDTQGGDIWYGQAFRGRFNGEGMLFYPGTEAGIDGPITTIRLKNIRDGMEDFEYFALLKNQGEKEFVNSVVREIAPNWWNYSKMPELLFNAREKLGKRISQLIK